MKHKFPRHKRQTISGFNLLHLNYRIADRYHRDFNVLLEPIHSPYELIHMEKTRKLKVKYPRDMLDELGKWDHRWHVDLFSKSGRINKQYKKTVKPELMTRELKLRTPIPENKQIYVRALYFDEIPVTEDYDHRLGYYESYRDE